MNLGQFHDRVESAIGRGSSLAAVVPVWVAESARLLEQNYTFSWMQRQTELTFAAGIIPLVYNLDALVKSVNWIKPIRASNSDGTRWYGDDLVGVESNQVLGINGGNPAGFWIDGTDGGFQLKLDAIPVSEWKALMSWNKYTDWPVADASTPTLLLRGQYALFCQTLIIFAQEKKDSRMVDQYATLLSGALNALLRSEEELKLQHQNDLKMNYVGLE